MLKLAVIGAQTLLGRELVGVLETRDCSVLPLASGPLSREEEEGDLVVFAPGPSLLEGLDAVVLADRPTDSTLLAEFPGRILDLREEGAEGEPMPLAGTWPPGCLRLQGRPALEQVLARIPNLVGGIGELSGTHLRSVAWMGDRGIEGLVAQTRDLLNGKEPDPGALGYRAAFELAPQMVRGSLLEVRTPTFHGDLLVLHLRAGEGQTLQIQEAPEGIRWVDAPPSSREVAVSHELLAHFQPADDGRRGTLVLGFDPILWGTLRPILRVLEL